MTLLEKFTMIRTVLFAAATATLAATAGLAQPPAGSIRPKLMSELPVPKAGDKLQLGRAEVKSKKDADGLLEVTEVVAAKDEASATIPAAKWELDADGWFDSEGFNLTRAYPRSGLWAMRTAKGNRPANATGSGLAGSPAALVPQAPARLYRAGPNDVITHIDGIAVTSYERYLYALNSTATPRDIPIVVMNAETGRRHIFYITAFKVN